MLKNLSAVIGGAASGKSRCAEQWAKSLPGRAVYLATAQAFDSEMVDKIAQHQRTRGDDWHTLEAPFALPKAILECQSQDAVLVDCATMWLSNLILSEHEIAPAEEALWQAIAKTPAQFIIVSNEVGAGIVPENALARRFRNIQGRFNQRLAQQATTVVGVMAGCPFALKGELPDIFQG